MKRLNVLVDADDVLETLLDLWLDALNRQFGTYVVPDDIDSWDISRAFPGIDKDKLYAPIYADSFWDKIEPMPGATDFLKNIIEDGHELYIVTATNYQTCGSKIKRLLELFPMLRWEQFIIASNKQMVKGDVLVDDYYMNLIGGDYEKILFDRPHNRNLNAETFGMTRVYTLEEAYKKICEIAGRKS